LRRKQKFVTKGRKGRLKKKIILERCMGDDKTKTYSTRKNDRKMAFIC